MADKSGNQCNTSRLWIGRVNRHIPRVPSLSFFFPRDQFECVLFHSLPCRKYIKSSFFCTNLRIISTDVQQNVSRYLTSYQAGQVQEQWAWVSCVCQHQSSRQAQSPRLSVLYLYFKNFIPPVNSVFISDVGANTQGYTRHPSAALLNKKKKKKYLRMYNKMLADI
jgi:hypothetical protein